MVLCPKRPGRGHYSQGWEEEVETPENCLPAQARASPPTPQGLMFPNTTVCVCGGQVDSNSQGQGGRECWDLGWSRRGTGT